MSYIRDYMTYVKLDEANENYHLWSCLITIASFLGRKVWVERPYGRIYPNLYVILVGLQGNRKTQAKNIAQAIMREVGGVPFASEATTREALITQMKEQEQCFNDEKNRPQTYAPVTICATEFKEFIAKDPVGIITFLTAIYDQDFYDYSTMKRGTDVIYNPYLNMLACETPEWLTSRLKESIVTGGFSRRVMYINEIDHKHIILKELPKEQADARLRLIQFAKEVLTLITGRFEMSPEAEAWYNKWYLSPKEPPDASMIGFYESKHTLLTKIAMLVAASEWTGKRIIEVTHLQIALGFIDEAEKKMVRVFAGSGRNELGPVAVKVTDMLERIRQPIPEKEVFSFLFRDCRDKREMEAVIEQVIRTKKAVRFTTTNETTKITRAYLCSRLFLPVVVQQQLERAGASLSDEALPSNLQSPPSSTPSGAPDLLQALRPGAPSPSAVEASPSPTAPADSEQTSLQSTPSHPTQP